MVRARHNKKLLFIRLPFLSLPLVLPTLALMIRLSSGEVLEICIILVLLLVNRMITDSHEVSYLKTLAVRTS